MGGVRMGGVAQVTLPPGPPFSLLEGATAPTDADQVNVWIVSGGGTALRITPYTDPTCSSPPCADEMHSPRLNPAGTQVAYCDFEPDSPFGQALWVVPADGSATYPITPLWSDGGDGSWANHPSWSSDGSKILFTYAGPDGGSYVGGTLGGRIMQSTYPGGVTTTLWTPDIQSPTQREEGAHPSFSPDGTKVAFLVNVQPGGGGTLSRQGLWVMNADGSSPTLLDNWDNTTSNTGWQYSGTQIAWSNDSQWIAYVAAGFAAGTGDGNVYKIKPDGTSKTLLATGYANGLTFHMGWGAWLADDSAVIAYGVNTGGGTAGIYSCAANGSGVTLIVSAANGPAGGQNFQGVYGWNGRYYWANTKSPSQTKMNSCLPDGSDLQVYFTTPPGDSAVSNGTSFEWL